MQEWKNVLKPLQLLQLMHGDAATIGVRSDGAWPRTTRRLRGSEAR